MGRLQFIAVGLVVIVSIATSGTQTVSAESVPIDVKVISNQTSSKPITIGIAPLQGMEKISLKPVVMAQTPPPPLEHIVADGECLAEIAEKYGTTWLRLYYKNTDIVDANQISVGLRLIIPSADEVLAERDVVSQVVVKTPSEPSYVAQASKPQTIESSGNTYDWGYCTWGVANWVAVPNGWGNANTWASRAANQGYRVDDSPSVGSVAASTSGKYGHVALVVGVDGDNVTIKEMNYRSLGVVSSRVVSASAFRYIHL